MRTLPRCAIAALLAVVASVSGCQNPTPTFGGSPAVAGRNADGLLSAVAHRFGPVRRSPHLTRIRPTLIRESLTPSALYADDALWTSTDGPVKSLTVTGTVRDGAYVLTTHTLAPNPRRIGEARHTISLRPLDDGSYEWTTRDELAVGTIGANGIADLMSGTLAAFEHRSEREIRAGYAFALPRTTRALSRLFSLDSIRPEGLDDGSTRLTIAVGMRSARARSEFPKLAEYVDRYVAPARYRIELVDGDGSPWLEARARGEQLVVRLRSSHGRLLPLEGPARPMPDSLEMRVELFAKIMMFRVGITELVGDFTMVRSPHERGFEVRFRQEPRWHFPLAAASLMRGSLRRPFDGTGMVLRLGAADSPTGQTLLTRDLTVALHENALLRWLNGLGTRVMEDYTQGVEAEADRFMGEAFGALQREIVSSIHGEMRVSAGH